MRDYKEIEKLANMLNLSQSDRKRWHRMISDEERMLRQQSKLRGEYLMWFASLESALEETIATHFCTEEDYRNMLCSSVLGKVQFTRKIEILNDILCSYDDSADIQRLRKNMPDLKKINKFRNDLAHRAPDVSNAYANDRVDTNNIRLYIREGKEVKSKEITILEFEKKLNEIKHACAILRFATAYVNRPCTSDS